MQVNHVIGAIVGAMEEEEEEDIFGLALSSISNQFPSCQFFILKEFLASNL